MSMTLLKNVFQKVKGKTIALVYTFQGDMPDGLEHFFVWKSEIVSKWMLAVEDLHCLPLILDVRTFVDKAINRTLPWVDFVLNLNTGVSNLSTMALVPSVCSALNIPCIPCSALSILTGEHKELSNLIANSIGLHIPKKISPKEKNGIFRPINLGNSLGVIRGSTDSNHNGIYQEFISGYEITTPATYNGITGRIELMPTVMYLPEEKNLDWFNGEQSKKNRTGYSFRVVELEESLQRKYLELISNLSIQTFCRIDGRVKSSSYDFYEQSHDMVLDRDTYFIEINVMPTIRDTNNFAYSFNAINEKHTMFSCIDAQKEVFENINIYTFLLANSMVSFSDSMKLI